VFMTDYCESCGIHFCRNLRNPVANMEPVEPVVGRSLIGAKSMANDKQFDEDSAAVADSTSIQRELMDDDSYYSDSKPVHGWTPKSLLLSPSRPQNDEISSSSEATQAGELH